MAQDASQIREAIEEDRRQLAETVQALAEKADVKGRIKDSISSNADQLREKAQRTAEDVGKRIQDLSPEEAKAQAAATADRVGKHVRSRPVPYGIGALLAFAWMLARLRKSRRR